MNAEPAALERIERLLGALRRAVAPASPERAALAARVEGTTGLSSAGVQWAIDHCLEQSPSDAELSRLVASVTLARRAHVILPGSVFVAAHRALALALAAAPQVFVKPSRREPALIAALYAQAPGLFEVVERIEPEPGDHVFAYGSDTTLEALRRELPKSTVLHAHGSGFGIAVVDLETAPAAPRAAGKAESDAEAVASEANTDRAMARAIAEDTACFDQRGCLSPRFVLALGDPLRARRFAARLATELAELELRIPLGRLDLDEQAEVTWYRQCSACFGDVFAAGAGSVNLRDAAEPAWLDEDGLAALEVPPAGRNLEVIAVRRLEPALEALRPWLTTVGCSSPVLEARVRPLLDPIRIAPLGRMQRPAFDGPVDRRANPRGEIIG